MLTPCQFLSPISLWSLLHLIKTQENKVKKKNPSIQFPFNPAHKAPPWTVKSRRCPSPHTWAPGSRDARVA